MKIERHCDIGKDFKKLKRFPAPEESLEAWERYFCLKGINETAGVCKYSGLGNDRLYKARVIPLKENCGKSDGYRLVFKSIDNDSIIILVFLRHGIYSDEKELMAIIKERL
ncbi:MAG: hypothetical protein BWY53_00038 [Parcubacteria group bacterium ADurb.Bin326]|nr:MAG: hypothetical protein BWY53_00038 [Parcubacteria group bacterium ADurb.Bin326]